jgi:hypothetical protein
MANLQEEFLFGKKKNKMPPFVSISDKGNATLPMQ